MPLMNFLSYRRSAAIIDRMKANGIGEGHKLGPSTSNTKIESWWNQLKDKSAEVWITRFRKLSHDHFFFSHKSSGHCS